MASRMKISFLLRCVTLIALLEIGHMAKSDPKCPRCTAEMIANCPPVKRSADCIVVDEPSCGCCKTCARKEGEYCGNAQPRCLSNLLCVPRPLTQYEQESEPSEDIDYEQYDSYDGFDYKQSPDDKMLFDQGRWICLDIQINADGPIRDQVPPSLKNTEEPNVIPVYPRSSTPPNPPVHRNAKRPCKRHNKRVNRQKRLKIHDWLPACRAGLYKPVQCELTFGQVPGRCWCVDSRGNSISGGFLDLFSQEYPEIVCQNLLQRSK